MEKEKTMRGVQSTCEREGSLPWPSHQQARAWRWWHYSLRPTVSRVSDSVSLGQRSPKSNIFPGNAVQQMLDHILRGLSAPLRYKHLAVLNGYNSSVYWSLSLYTTAPHHKSTLSSSVQPQSSEHYIAPDLQLCHSRQPSSLVLNGPRERGKEGRCAQAQSDNAVLVPVEMGRRGGRSPRNS